MRKLLQEEYFVKTPNVVIINMKKDNVKYSIVLDKGEQVRMFSEKETLDNIEFLDEWSLWIRENFYQEMDALKNSHRISLEPEE